MKISKMWCRKMAELEEGHTVSAGENVPTVEVPKASLLKVVRKLDFNAPISDAEFAAAFDDLRAAFTPDEIAFGKTYNQGRRVK